MKMSNMSDDLYNYLSKKYADMGNDPDTVLRTVTRKDLYKTIISVFGGDVKGFNNNFLELLMEEAIVALVNIDIEEIVSNKIYDLNLKDLEKTE